MLNELLLPLREYFGFLNLFEYITFRAGASAILALLISFIFGPFIVKKLINLQIGESIRDYGPQSHKEKQGTPTMGGVLIILSTIIPTILLADLNNLFIQIICISMVWMGLVGFYDDYLKSIKKKNGGLAGRYKLIAQSMLGIFISFMIINSGAYVVSELGFISISEFPFIKITIPIDNTYSTFVPFLKYVSIDFLNPFIYTLFIILVVSATSNAVNLTDGLDGLASGLLAISISVFGVIAYISGRVDFTDYLYISYLPQASELTIFATAFFGGCLGFLWFNAKPAEIFMGDVGSLSSGAALGTLAILLKKEVLLLIVGGVFVIETLSVIIQVLYFRYTKNKYGEGKKFFLMTPIHHHFELKGWPESKIVTRFWIIGILFALMSLTTFKVR